MDKLATQDIEQKLQQFPNWSLTGDSLQRTFNFDNFLQAMSFVTRIAELAEDLGHHPDILIRYNKVTLTVSTHDAGGLTDKDFEFARQADVVINSSAKPAVHAAKRKGAKNRA
jgi:4a-hydroxytetrahydrobiopterin dehydratase